MVERIKAHNKLNGIIFSTLEFALIALVIAPFAAYYVLNAQLLMAAISTGILLNCLVIVAFGLHSWLGGNTEKGAISMRALWRNKTERERLSAEYPNMGGDTTMLVVSLLIPFMLLALTLYELVIARFKGRG
jgi:small-conductance mechanosensitive channel